MGLTELDIKKVIVNGDVKYKVNGEIFDTFEAAQEYIHKLQVLIHPEVEAMSGEELRAAADEIIRESQVKTAKAVGLKR